MRKRVHLEQLKLQTLPPLWTSFILFSKKKLELRHFALKGCWLENLLYIRLVSSNPLTPDLFAPEAVAHVTNKAEAQAKSLLQVLEYKPPAQKRKASMSRKMVKRQKVAKNQGQEPRQ